MEWICQLGDGRMMARDGDNLRRVTTGYPYPDTRLPQQEMLQELYELYSVDYNINKISKDFALIIRKFNSTFDSRGDVVPASLVLIGGSKSDVDCLYRGKSFGIYKLSSLQGLFPLGISEFFTVNTWNSMQHFQAWQNVFVLVLPSEYETKFSAYLNLPKQYQTTSDASIMFFEGYTKPTLFSWEEWDLMHRNDATNIVSVYDYGLSRVMFACAPRLGLNHLPWKGIASIIGSCSLLGKLEWLPDLRLLTIDKFLNYWGSILKDNLEELRDYILVHGFHNVCVNCRMWSHFQRISNAREYICVKDEGLGAALGRKWRLCPSPITDAMWVYKKGYVGIHHKGWVLFSLPKLFGSDFSQFGYEALMTNRNRTYCDCTWVVASILGVSLSHLSKLLTLSVKNDIGRLTDYSHIYCKMFTCDSVSANVIMLGYGVDSLSSITQSKEGDIIANFRMLTWMPDLLYKFFDFDKFYARYPKDIQAVALWRLGLLIQMPDKIKWLNAFAEHRYTLSWVQETRMLTVKYWQ